MIYISMQGADGSSSAFVNSFHTELAKPGIKCSKKKKKLMEGDLQSTFFYSSITITSGS